jgi:hypothetical protein
MSATGRGLAVLVAVVLLATGGAIYFWQHSQDPPTDPPGKGPAPPTEPTPGIPWFVDVTKRSGADFRHFDSATPMHYIPETMGSGVAWIDYDNDGWLDLFCVQDGPLKPAKTAGQLPTNRLFRNNGDLTFTDVTVAVGLDRSGYGMGCAVGDFDNDGFDDLLVTYLGELVLYRNVADGQKGRRFQDVTSKSGLRDAHWATSCAWGDIDGDGLLDLYVCNYVSIDLDKYLPCVDKVSGEKFICPPSVFPTVHHQLYRNKGDGTFEDISSASGVAAAPPAPGLGVIMVDLDDDNLLDIYVANDMKPAYLFHNRGQRRFEEKALFAGCGLESGGRFMAGMGVDAGDVDGSGRPSLFVTNFQKEPNILFRNRGKLFFQDWSNPSGLGPPSLPRLAFGTVFADFDLDGNLDVAVANGHVVRNAKLVYNDPFEQEAQLFMGDGQARFRDVSAKAGGYFHAKRVGRGLAWADYDNDGRPDLVFSHNGGPLALLHNETPDAGNWLRLELVGDGKKSNRNAIGSRLEIEVGGRKLTRFINGGGS